MPAGTASVSGLGAEILKQGNRWTVIFLVDDIPPRNIILLKRAPDKSFAPDLYTGIGGKVGDIPGLETETPLDSAYRELFEETQNELGPAKVKLKEFARCIFADGRRLYYFFGKYQGETPPDLVPGEGTLRWVPVSELLNYHLIPATRAVCQEWSNRRFATKEPFTLYVEGIGKEGTVSLIGIQKTVNGLN